MSIFIFSLPLLIFNFASLEESFDWQGGKAGCPQPVWQAHQEDFSKDRV